MRGVLLFALMLMSTAGDRLAATGDRGDAPLAVTLQIHDYVHLPPAALSGASDLVTRIYDAIGVKTTWLPPVRQDAYRAGHPSAREPSHNPIAQLTILVLTPEMTARGHIEEGILGFAAVPPEGLGRIAYVIYHRVRQQAANADVAETTLFGLVMAHEIGHLLLGPGSQGEAGLMKGIWDRRDLQQFQTVTPGFSRFEASEIRSMLEGDASALASR